MVIDINTIMSTIQTAGISFCVCSIFLIYREIGHIYDTVHKCQMDFINLYKLHAEISVQMANKLKNCMMVDRFEIVKGDENGRS